MRPSTKINDQPGLRQLAISVGPSAGAPLETGWFSGQMRIVWAVVLLYAASFVCFYPQSSHQL